MKDRIKQIRKAEHLTQQEFADRIGASRGSIASYEIGTRTPLDSVITLIARTFNVNETWLRTGEGQMFREVSNEEQIAAFVGRVLSEESDNFKRRFLHVLSQFDDSDWEAMEKWATMLMKEKED